MVEVPVRRRQLPRGVRIHSRPRLARSIFLFRLSEHSSCRALRQGEVGRHYRQSPWSARARETTMTFDGHAKITTDILSTDARLRRHGNEGRPEDVTETNSTPMTVTAVGRQGQHGHAMEEMARGT